MTESRAGTQTWADSEVCSFPAYFMEPGEQMSESLTPAAAAASLSLMGSG